MNLLLDKDGFLQELGCWNVEVANTLALGDAVVLDERHWEVIELLREFYQRTEVAPSMRPFVKLVRESIGQDKGNSIYLMQLFGSSPAKTAAKWSGLPRPTNCL